MPPGSGNSFVPPPQLLIHGAVTCEVTALHSSHPDVSAADCEILARILGLFYSLLLVGLKATGLGVWGLGFRVQSLRFRLRVGACDVQ